MAVYKVPQDVEADDKLIGPFTFRQFIYLLIVAAAMFLAWIFYQLAPPLAFITSPIIIFFGALALPLKKDQPMEIYMAALVSFYLKPRRRIWEADGIDSLIEVTAPKVVDFQLTKNLSVSEAEKRLSYLAEIVDSRGWAVRNPSDIQTNNSVNTDVYFEAQEANDILDSNNFRMQEIDNKLTESTNRHHQQVIEAMKLSSQPEQPIVDNTISNENQQNIETKLVFNPYPTEIHQKVIQPVEQYYQQEYQSAQNITQKQPDTSNTTVSADIINLANNRDLSIETIANEAKRISQKQEINDEVVISLR